MIFRILPFCKESGMKMCVLIDKLLSIKCVLIKGHQHRPWWPSGLRRHAISQLTVATKGPSFKTHSRQRIYMDEFIWSQFAPVIIVVLL